MAAWQDSCWCMNVCAMVALLYPSCPDNVQSMALQEVGGGHLVNEEQMDLVGRMLHLLLPPLLPPSLCDFSVFPCSWALPPPSFYTGGSVCMLPSSNKYLWSEPSVIPANTTRKFQSYMLSQSLLTMSPAHSSPGPSTPSWHMTELLLHRAPPRLADLWIWRAASEMWKSDALAQQKQAVGNRAHLLVFHSSDMTYLIIWEGLSWSPSFGTW